jgi:hypothetical protein
LRAQRGNLMMGNQPPGNCLAGDTSMDDRFAARMMRSGIREYSCSATVWDVATGYTPGSKYICTTSARFVYCLLINADYRFVE